MVCFLTPDANPFRVFREFDLEELFGRARSARAETSTRNETPLGGAALRKWGAWFCARDGVGEANPSIVYPLHAHCSVGACRDPDGGGGMGFDDAHASEVDRARDHRQAIGPGDKDGVFCPGDVFSGEAGRTLDGRLDHGACWSLGLHDGGRGFGGLKPATRYPGSCVHRDRFSGQDAAELPAHLEHVRASHAGPEGYGSPVERLDAFADCRAS